MGYFVTPPVFNDFSILDVGRWDTLLHKWDTLLHDPPAKPVLVLVSGIPLISFS